MPDLGFTELFTRQDADYGSRTFTAADPWLVSWSFGTYPDSRQPASAPGAPVRPSPATSPDSSPATSAYSGEPSTEIPDLGDTAAGTRTPSGAPYRRFTCVT